MWVRQLLTVVRSSTFGLTFQDVKKFNGGEGIIYKAEIIF